MTLLPPEHVTAAGPRWREVDLALTRYPSKVPDRETMVGFPSDDPDPVAGLDPTDPDRGFRLDPDPLSLRRRHHEVGGFEHPLPLPLPIGDQSPHDVGWRRDRRIHLEDGRPPSGEQRP